MLAYIEGMLCATYGVNLIGGFVPEWQIDAVKKYAQKLKEEIDHALLTSTEKDNQKDCWSDGLKQQLKVSKTNYVEKVGCYRTKKKLIYDKLCISKYQVVMNFVEIIIRTHQCMT